MMNIKQIFLWTVGLACAACNAAALGGESDVLNVKTAGGWEVQIDVNPRQILFGDSVFFLLKCVNRTDEPQCIPLEKGRISCRCETFSELQYEYCAQTPIFHDEVVPFTVIYDKKRFEPDGEIEIFPTEIVTPPLADWNHPFWQKVRKTLETSDEIRLWFDVEFTETSQDSKIHFSFSVSMKARPKREMEWIRCWFETTPTEIFTGNLDFQKSSVIQKWEYYVQISGADFYPWGLISGQMPSGAGVPQTLFGWKTLEKSLSPGTLRDHVSMTRRTIELLENPETGVPSYGIPYVSGDYAFAEFDEWLAMLPKAQRLCFTNALTNPIHPRVLSYAAVMPPVPPQELMEYLFDDYFSQLNHIQAVQREISQRFRLISSRYKSTRPEKCDENRTSIFRTLQNRPDTF